MASSIIRSIIGLACGMLLGLPTCINASSFTLKTKHSQEAGVGLVEDMGFQPSSELSSTDGWRAQMKRKTVPDSWSSNINQFNSRLVAGPRAG